MFVVSLLKTKWPFQKFKTFKKKKKKNSLKWENIGVKFMT